MANSMFSSSIVANQDRQHHDQVVFEDIADQYVKGDDVIVRFIILHEIKVNPQEDQIGLLRVGSTNIQECLAYADIKFDASTRRGIAKFPSESLPTTDDEFYQFCYIINKRKSLGSSIPFQLNCSIDDIDLLSQSSIEKSSNNGLISFADHDNDDLVVIHTKRMLMEEKLRQENRQLLEVNRRLEHQKEECKTKFDLLELKSNEYINKVKHDMQVLAATHKSTIDELSKRQHLEAKLRAEYDACRALCNQYQNESLQFAERCRELEDRLNQLNIEEQKLRVQLSNTSQSSEEQAKQIADAERRCTEANDLLKTAHQYQAQLEQQLRDLRLTSEKYQKSVQGQLDAYAKQAAQQENQINALESANNLLKDEIHTMKDDNTFLLAMTKEDQQMKRDLQKKIEDLIIENEKKDKELIVLRNELEQVKANQDSYSTLKNSFTEIEKRCVKHQKSEIEVKRQLTVYKDLLAKSDDQIQDLTSRLSAGADEYTALFRKCAALERMLIKASSSPVPKINPTTLSNETGLNEEALVTLLRNSYELQQQEAPVKEEEEEEEEEDEEEEEKKSELTETIIPDEEIRECPMCYWEFPKHLTLENKKEHIENHFA